MPILNYLPSSISELELIYDNPTVFPAAFSVYQTGAVTYVAAPSTSQEVFAKCSTDTDAKIEHEIYIYPMRKMYIQPTVMLKRTSSTDAPWLQIDPGHIYKIERIAYPTTSTSAGVYRIYKDGTQVYTIPDTNHTAKFEARLFNWKLELDS